MELPPTILSDSYKASHYALFPKDAKKMVAYGEFRHSLNKDQADSRLVYYGIRYIIDNYIAKRWTQKDIDEAEMFYGTHGPGTPFPFPKKLFQKIVNEHDGWFPAKIESLMEGSVCYPHVPVYQITTEKEFAPLCTWLETLLTMVWYPSTVATISRRSKSIIRKAFEKSVDEDCYWLLESRLHDFGFRGCTSVEQTIIGGSAHLLNFGGTDTMSAAYYVQYHLNDGKPIGSSIPATEHSVMTSWPTEKGAITNLIENYGDGLYACVMDSYDYKQALERLLPVVADEKVKKGGTIVLRPDSGDPVETVLMALENGEKVFGCTKNKKGFKVLNGCAVIQGDAVTENSLRAILDSSLARGYSAQNIAFGMGAGLLQKMNRDSMSFATKLSSIVYADGTKRDIMKMPKMDSQKRSLPGELSVLRDSKTGVPKVYPKKEGDENDPNNMLKVVYNYGKKLEWEKFDTVRSRVETEWRKLPETADVISKELSEKIEKVIVEQNRRTEEMLKQI